MNNKNFVIITAGGIGNRMNSEIPKQFLKIADEVILMMTIRKFYDYDYDLNILLSLPENYISYWNNLCEKEQFKIKHSIVAGGQTRFHSVKNALNRVTGDGYVAVHDGVRPLVSAQTIMNTFVSAQTYGNGIAALPIDFSLRKTIENSNISENREQFKQIQTPQTFSVNILKKAYELNYDNSFTDDATVVEKTGEKIFLCEGNKENIKITTAFDIKFAEFLLNGVF